MNETFSHKGVSVVSTGWIDRNDMKLVYASYDAVLMPSICFDSFPRIVLEPIAMGKPVIATHYGEAKEIVLNGVSGYVINPFDVKEIADKITNLLVDDKKGEKFGIVGRDA
ncbi:MAG: glycosyltransferase family 4 protein [Candidatus Vogelbacteria bacterium]|nr:glycosyltransferase family 4 protein [Candidatus Vogelbacteria bacterium]